jgi:hypothetical protein
MHVFLQVFYHNLGHMDVFETCLSRFLGIEHLSDLMQLPMSACLEAASLGMYICPLYRELGCTSVGDLAILQESHLKDLGMDTQQVQWVASHRGPQAWSLSLTTSDTPSSVAGSTVLCSC